ncbi:hypothetical protein HK102_007019, partial [Quaeritorhiza haematococci]
MSTTAPQSTKLRGVERIFALSPLGSTKIAHVLAVSNFPAFLIPPVSSPASESPALNTLTRAFLGVVNANPRMRATQDPIDPLKVHISPPISEDEANKRRLVRVVEEPEQERDGGWEAFVREECERVFDKKKEFPFYLVLMVPAAKSKVEKKEEDGEGEEGLARLILISDHYMSDGFSGLVVLNAFLQNLTTITSSNPSTSAPIQEHPL